MERLTETVAQSMSAEPVYERSSVYEPDRVADSIYAHKSATNNGTVSTEGSLTTNGTMTVNRTALINGTALTNGTVVRTRDVASELGHFLEQELVGVQELLTEQLRSDYDAVARLMESAAALQGKRLRPRLSILSAVACGGSTPDTRRVAAVVELVHAATLVHDDVLDNADKRRGAPASHVTWGNHASILLGDLLFSKAFVLAATLGSGLVAQRVGRAGIALCEGELRQQQTVGNWTLSVQEYLHVLRQKTGDLCAASSFLGAWSAGASNSWQAALEIYGQHLGIAFQIYDDWLDVWGTAALGKPLGNDLANRKPTLPTLCLIQHTSAAQRSLVIAALDAGVWTAELREKLDRSDAYAATLDMARDFAESACRALAPLPDSSAKQALIALAKQSVRRSR